MTHNAEREYERLARHPKGLYTSAEQGFSRHYNNSKSRVVDADCRAMSIAVPLPSDVEPSLMT